MRRHGAQCYDQCGDQNGVVTTTTPTTTTATAIATCYYESTESRHLPPCRHWVARPTQVCHEKMSVGHCVDMVTTVVTNIVTIIELLRKSLLLLHAAIDGKSRVYR